jgi:polar amino acid transport system substrate-binding protein
VGPYFISGKSILTKLKTIAVIDGPAQLNSPQTTLAALKDSTSQQYVERSAPKARLIKTDDYDQAIDMILKGKVDALVADYPICVVSVYRYPNQQLTTLTKPLTYEPIGIAVSPNDSQLVNWLGNFLTAMKGTGELERLEHRWLKNASWLKLLPPK